jgi:hypothetical protein
MDPKFNDARLKLTDKIMKSSDKFNKCQKNNCKTESKNFAKLVDSLGNSYNVKDLYKLYASKEILKLGSCTEKQCHKYLDTLLKDHLNILRADSVINKKQQNKLLKFEKEYNKNPKDYAKLYSLFLSIWFIQPNP